MNKQTEALKLALEALEVATTPLAKDRQEVLRAQAVIREALAEKPAQQTCLVANEPCKHDSWCSEVYCQEHCKFVEQPAQQQEPVAWLIWLHGPAGHFDHKQFAEMEFERRNKEYPDPDRKLLPLYTTPPQRKPLTDDEIHAIYDEVARREPYNMAVTRRNIARAIEARSRH